MEIIGLRRGVRDVLPYVPGKTIEEVKRELGLTDVIKLGSNENPYAPFNNSFTAMRNELKALNCYPDVTFKEIKRLLAERFNLTSENFAISHGAEGMLQTLGKCFLENEDEVIIPKVTYSLYHEISKLMGAKVIETSLTNKLVININSIMDALTEKTKLVWLCNPNNPTGTIFPKEDLEYLLGNLPRSTWVVLDEAYAEFAEKNKLPDTVDFIKNNKKIIMVRTFSKAFGLAGARIGYAMASPKMINIIDTVSEPFNANRVGLAGATAALKYDRKQYLQSLETIISDRKRLEEALQKMGCGVVASHTNFVYFYTPLKSTTLTEILLQNGVIVRPCNGWGLENGIRVTVGTTEECNKFLATLKNILADYCGLTEDS
ncbi:MAG: histidinol-phosphate transaminase [Bacillota bacterium]